MIAGISKKLVVDRAGFSYSNPANNLAMANLRFRHTEMRHIPNVMANLFGLKADGNPLSALTTKRIRGAIMADRFSILRDDSVKARFWAKVDVRGPDDCWDWQASLNTSGYGRFKYASYRQTGAHRVALILHTGEDRPDLCALHSCDRPACVNPAHLRWGTHMENTTDKMERGRVRNGVLAGFTNPRCTLTPDQLAEIVRLIDHSNLNNKQIAPRFNLTHQMISKIRTGNSWKPEVAAIRQHARNAA